LGSHTREMGRGHNGAESVAERGHSTEKLNKRKGVREPAFN